MTNLEMLSASMILQPKRKKRGAIDIIGNVANAVFGVLDSELGLQVSSSSICIEGVEIGKLNSKSRTIVSVQSKVTNYKTILEAFVLPKILYNQPSQHLQISDWYLPSNIQLADPTFYKSDKVDMLLGVEFYHQLLSPGQTQLSRELPILQNTMLGWIVSVKIQNANAIIATCGIASEDSLQNAIEQLWKVEEVDTHSKVFSIAEQQCEAQFTQTTYQNVTGRFIDSHLKRQYVDFLDEYKKLGHMTEIDIERIMSSYYFIPHHCVLKPDSTTTKLRVVFDASSKTTSGQSRNDLLHIGPIARSELLSILLRFQLPRFVFTTDIEKMYRQILVHPEDSQCQLIVWRNHLATKYLQALADDNVQNYPLGASALKEDFYVDDCLHEADSLKTLLETQSQLNKILTASGFKLRKWCANHPSLLQ
ncbi:uncharacterized protein LOC119665773 [Teleopsis dalmanni]|uniref:uncharacterized protein LOC119665773 n=1 Tax=Teleopsis dalmanni TaxID=139649 RepID=UPI0018CCA1C9|nr:uncharacterized protein LOC119665773 [Teleopsis dalmanni]